VSSPTQLSAERRFFEEFFRPAPPTLDAEGIWQDRLALKPPYQVEERQLPLPVWARRAFTDSGEQAWAALRRDAAHPDPARPFCIYVHIPFCASRCRFCDCYSFPLRGGARQVERYTDLLGREMRLWSRLERLAGRPVSTVHFGGGTPTFLGEAVFGRLAASCREHFGTDPATEWALESTTSELTGDMISRLSGLGFTRLHLGVQSLEDRVRRLIGRREPAGLVLDKIARATALGWVVSVDLIYGLPGQSLAGWLDDIQALAAAGVDGFSLYELQISSRNLKFAREQGLLGRLRLGSYFMIQAASRLLTSLGYRKTLFNHYARARDTNLYFTFPERGEDCLALGAIADGVFGNYHYRHPEYAAYCRGVEAGAPGLQGGLLRSDRENRIHPLEVALLSGRIPPDLFADTLGELPAAGLLRRWAESALVAEGDPPAGMWSLTASGSWFVGAMMAEL
jgi:oxygen-independent coproporphyrinogen-3 oxidase